MIQCESCHHENDPSSKYCPECGTQLINSTETSEQNSADDVNRDIAQAYQFIQKKQYNNALKFSTQVLKNYPHSSEAMSLMGDCHQELGELHLALYYFEKAFDANPQSTVDRLKINQISQQIAKNQESQDQGIHQRKALIVASSSALLILAIGLCTLYFSNFVKSKSPVVASPKPLEIVEGFGEIKPVKAAEKSQEQPSIPDPLPPGQLAAGAPLPLPTHDGDTFVDQVETKPIHPLPERYQITHSPSEAIDAPKESGTSEEPKPGIVEITKVKAGAPIKTAGKDVTWDAELKSAHNHFMLSEYTEAIRQYQSALRKGADLGPVEQRIGQCYEKINQPNNARQSYQRALRYFESKIAKGEGNVSLYQTQYQATLNSIQSLKDH